MKVLSPEQSLTVGPPNVLHFPTIRVGSKERELKFRGSHVPKENNIIILLYLKC